MPSISAAGYSLKFCEGLEVLNLLDLVVVEVQLIQRAQLLQVLNLLDQVLTQAQYLGREREPH